MNDSQKKKALEILCGGYVPPLEFEIDWPVWFVRENIRWMLGVINPDLRMQVFVSDTVFINPFMSPFQELLSYVCLVGNEPDFSYNIPSTRSVHSFIVRQTGLMNTLGHTAKFEPDTLLVLWDIITVAMRNFIQRQRGPSFTPVPFGSLMARGVPAHLILLAQGKSLQIMQRPRISQEDKLRKVDCAVAELYVRTRILGRLSSGQPFSATDVVGWLEI